MTKKNVENQATALLGRLYADKAIVPTRASSYWVKELDGIQRCAVELHQTIRTIPEIIRRPLVVKHQDEFPELIQSVREIMNLNKVLTEELRVLNLKWADKKADPVFMTSPNDTIMLELVEYVEAYQNWIQNFNSNMLPLYGDVTECASRIEEKYGEKEGVEDATS